MNSPLTSISLISLLIVTSSWSIDDCSAKQIPSTEIGNFERTNQSFAEPIEYVLGKLKDYDLVMIGERHWRRQEPLFIQNLIKRCFETNAINVVFLEFGRFEDQEKIDAFMDSQTYDPKPIIDALRNCTIFGWGYQEYFDIFKLIYDENSKRPAAEKIRLILTDPELKGISFDAQLYNCLKNSPLPEKKKWQVIAWIRDSIKDRDQSMSAVIEAYIFQSGLKGIYYAGSSHIRKDLQKKDNGRQYFSTGGILTRKYPGRVCCLTFHKQPEFWQNVNSFNYLEELFQSFGKSFAVDTKDPPISRLKLKSDVLQDGVSLSEAFDGYVILNLDKDYQPCSHVPDFYDDEFAKIVWDRLRGNGVLERLPQELAKWKDKTPTGSELTWMVEEYGLR
jgi:hypothetical protein